MIKDTTVLSSLYHQSKSTFSKRQFPLSLLVFFLAVLIIFVFVQAKNFGITADEVLQDNYGHSILVWYTSMGKDTSFLMYGAGLYMPEHGPLFEVIVAAAQDLFAGHHWYVRAVITGLAGVSGIVAIAMCGYTLEGYWFALLAAIAFWLYPRFFGAIFNNSKDVPFAAAMTFVLWSVLLLIKQWQKNNLYVRNCFLVGIFIGIAASIRVTAIIYYFLLFLLSMMWWLENGLKSLKQKEHWAALGKHLFAASLISISSFITMMVCWPYIFLNPFQNFYDSIVVMQRYPWNGSVLFNGVLYLGQHLPWTYVPVWLIIGTPLIVDIFTFIGCIWILSKRLKTKVSNPQTVMLCIALFVPVLLMIFLHATLYDGLRQFLFLTPNMILIATYGFIHTLRLFWLKKQLFLPGILIVVITLASYGMVLKTMADIHPYEYAYFNELVGGIPGAAGKYEMDYWGICSKPAGEWLVQHYREYTHKQHPTVLYQPIPEQGMLYLPNFTEDRVRPDFFIASTRDNFGNHFPTYTVIHTEKIQNTAIVCVIKMRPALSST